MKIVKSDSHNSIVPLSGFYTLQPMNLIHTSLYRMSREGEPEGMGVWLEGQSCKEEQRKQQRREGQKVLMVHLMYSGLKPRVVFFYALHRQTTCEHLDINRYEKKVCVRG